MPKTFNATSFPLTRVDTPAQAGTRSVSFVVKATFDLVPGGRATPSKTQQPLTIDIPFMDEVGRSLAWPDDLVPYKPHTDFFVVGAFHQPDGIAAPSGRCGFSFGPLRKTVSIHGPRYALLQDDGHWFIGDAAPVRTVPLRWEYSYGGIANPQNPYGLGMEIETLERRKMVRLPLIEDPAAPLRGMQDRPAPTNLCAVPMMFQSRRRKLGTRDRKWALFRAPLLPTDFDPSHANAAPDDQQVGNYPKGNEPLVLRNLHPEHPKLATALPGLRVRLAVLRAGKGEGVDGLVPEEVPMNIDTVVALPEENQLVLIWRGVAPLGELGHEDELPWEECIVETLGQPPSEPDLPARLLARAQAQARSDAAKANATDKATAAEMAELSAKANLPPDLAKMVASEPDSAKLFKALEAHFNTAIDAIEARAAKVKPGKG